MDSILIALGACALLQAAPASSELSLDGARSLALERNLGLQIEELATEAALMRYRATGGAFDWVYDASLSYTDQQIEPSDFFSASNRKVQQLSTGFTRPLETGGNLRASFESSLVESDSSFAVDPRASTDLLTLAYSQPLLRGAWRDYATASVKQGEQDWMRQRERERSCMLQMTWCGVQAGPRDNVQDAAAERTRQARSWRCCRRYTWNRTCVWARARHVGLQQRNTIWRTRSRTSIARARAVDAQDVNTGSAALTTLAPRL